MRSLAIDYVIAAIFILIFGCVSGIESERDQAITKQNKPRIGIRIYP
jgi:hypothetical protein